MSNSNPLSGHDLSPGELLRSIDWPLLKEQKKTFLELMYQQENDENTTAMPALEGILDIIDALQDCAVDYLDIDENIVFDLSKD